MTQLSEGELYGTDARHNSERQHPALTNSMNRSNHIDRIRIQGFRSLADVEAKLPRLAVLIGANGSGKSNFLRFFELMHCMALRRLGEFVARQGGADDQLFAGSKQTPEISATVTLETGTERIEYDFSLRYALPDELMVTKEVFRKAGPRSGIPLEFPAEVFDRPRSEARLGEFRQAKRPGNTHSMGIEFGAILQRTHVFQFHDTSDSSRLKQRWDAEDNNMLRPDAANIAAVLLRLERDHTYRFDRISRHIRRVIPVFDRFDIEESSGKVMLRWKPRGTSKTIGPHLTSDGSLRFFALVTLLNLPTEMLPSVMLIDEPELGLHPVAMELIAHMVMQVANDCQVILATQSPYFVNCFGLDQTVVLDILRDRTEIRTLRKNDYERWIQDYSPAELWHKNLLGGRP